MISIIIPAYNEEKRIGKTLDNYKGFFKNSEIIVVCDGQDNTAEIAKSKKLKVLEFQRRLGKGLAIRKGLLVAQGSIIGFVDADGSVSAKEFKKLIDEINGHDCAIASRRLKESKIEGDSAIRKFLRKSFNILVNSLFFLGIKDTQCGGKVLKRTVLKSILPELKTREFEFDIELLWNLKKNNFRIKEVPIVWTHTPATKMPINIPKMIITLLRLRFNL